MAGHTVPGRVLTSRYVRWLLPAAAAVAACITGFAVLNARQMAQAQQDGWRVTTCQMREHEVIGPDISQITLPFDWMRASQFGQGSPVAPASAAVWPRGVDSR